MSCRRTDVSPSKVHAASSWRWHDVGRLAPPHERECFFRLLRCVATHETLAARLALLHRTEALSADAGACYLCETESAVDLRVEETPFGRSVEQCAEDVPRDVDVLVDVARSKLDFERFSRRVVADRGHHGGIDGSAFHAG